MKILILNTFYYPNMQGGAEQSVKLLAEGLVKAGHDVAVYCIDSKERRKEIVEINGVTVYRCTANKFNLYRFSYDKESIGKIEKVRQKLLCYRNVKCNKDFEEICEAFKPDVIHSNSVYGISYIVWKAAYKKGIPLTHTIRDIGIVSPVQFSRKANPVLKSIHKVYMRHYSKYVLGVTAPSDYTLSTSLKTGCFRNARIKKKIYNSVEIDYEEFHHIMEEKKKRSSSHVKFMYAGRLIYFKGIKCMLDAFEKMRDKDCELHICGDGEMLPEVMEQSEKNDKIVYCGKLDNQELKKKYIECDVLIVPSAWPEPFGRVVIEGNKYSLPVIAGDCGGIPEIYNVLNGGELFTPNDVLQLSEKMTCFLERDKIVSYFNHIEKNIGTFDITEQIKAYEFIYKDLIRRVL